MRACVCSQILRRKHCFQFNTSLFCEFFTALLDDLDKELNNYNMRCREWYGWHFPELGKIITDNLAYAKTVNLMGMHHTNTNDTQYSTSQWCNALVAEYCDVIYAVLFVTTSEATTLNTSDVFVNINQLLVRIRALKKVVSWQGIEWTVQAQTSLPFYRKKWNRKWRRPVKSPWELKCPKLTS